MKSLAIVSICFLFLGHSFLWTQVPKDHFSRNYFEKQRFAHRGGYANGPENTLKTILSNIESGVCAIEVDILLTKDDHLVLFHDKTIGRILNSDSDRLVADMTLSEMKAIPLRDTTHGIQFVCSLRDLVDTLIVLIPEKPKNDFILELDFKPHGDQTDRGVQELMDIFNQHFIDFGERLYSYFFISTFYPEVLKKLEKADPKINKGFAVNNAAKENRFKARLAILLAPHFVRKYRAEVYEPNMCMINPRRVKMWHRRGVLINAWTANTACEKRELEKYAIAYTTNCPIGNCEPDESDQIGKAKKWCKKCVK